MRSRVEVLRTGSLNGASLLLTGVSFFPFKAGVGHAPSAPYGKFYNGKRGDFCTCKLYLN